MGLPMVSALCDPQQMGLLFITMQLVCVSTTDSNTTAMVSWLPAVRYLQAQNLIKAGYKVVVWNRSEQKCDPLKAAGAEVGQWVGVGLVGRFECQTVETHGNPCVRVVQLVVPPSSWFDFSRICAGCGCGFQ
jgi:hypothetical protein